MLAGVIGVCLAIRTLRGIEAQGGLMERQTRVLERQADLMQASMTQWVSVTNWKVVVSQRVGPLSEKPISLLAQFDITNESNFPLILEAEIRFFGKGPGASRVMAGNPLLLPRNPLTFDVPLWVTAEQAQQYTEGALRISVHGELSHIGVSKSRGHIMGIHGNLVCGKSIETHLEFESIEMVRPNTEQKDEQDPN
jgi:hypothetical protein